MEQRFRSIVDELSDYTPHRNRDLFIESKGQQLLASAGNLIKLIRETYDAETADDLTKRLARAIQSGDEEKFTRRIRVIRESKSGKGDA